MKRQVEEIYMHSDCEGCFGAVSPCYCAIRDLYANYDDCPCMNCLIKIMCSVVCKERKDYYTNRGMPKDECGE